MQANRVKRRSLGRSGIAVFEIPAGAIKAADGLSKEIRYPME
jgi:hypothetical protein